MMATGDPFHMLAVHRCLAPTIRRARALGDPVLVIDMCAARPTYPRVGQPAAVKPFRGRTDQLVNIASDFPKCRAQAILKCRFGSAGIAAGPRT